MQYFNEDLFPEDAFLTESNTDHTSTDNPLPSASSDTSINPKTLHQYFKTSDNAKDSPATCQEMASNDSDATVDWADDTMDVVLDNICDSDYGLEEPVTKKSKVN